ncbi:MAG: hypothetical protein LBG74_07435 [Spirochaetaceae bacterium]|jgi:hypothetical protein|nr:hypothetical protein [Spirochaetaceae bacterium]
MPHTRDFVPARDAEFDGWLANLTGYVEAKSGGASPLWTHIPADKITALKGQNAEWHAAFAKMLGPHTSVDTEAKNEARRAVEAFVRQFVAQYLKFDPVTNEDRTAMHLHNRDNTHSSIGKPTTRALISELKGLGGFRTEVRFHDETTPGSHAIPYGMNGALLNFAFGAEKITDYELLKNTMLMTRSPFTLPLGPDAEGAFLSCAARWQNEKGELGPWGEVLHIVVG